MPAGYCDIGSVGESDHTVAELELFLLGVVFEVG